MKTAVVLRYSGFEFARVLRNIQSTFFIVVLPVALFLMFGMDQGSQTEQAGHGNVTALVMVSMALYGAVIATTSQAGSAAVERQSGWSRQLALTALSSAGYVVGKMLVALAISLLPILAVNIAGMLVGAQFDSVWLQVNSAVLCLVGAIPFTLFGLATALVFRSDAAVGAASGLVVVLAFFGNLFMPLSGSLLSIARFTPLYGPALLVRWPLLEGGVATSDSTLVQDPMWVALAGIVAWTIIFGVICLVAARRTTARA